MKSDPGPARDPSTEAPTVPEPLGKVPVAVRSSGAGDGPKERESFDASRFPPGAVLVGRYRMVSFLGRGGMGEVYRADDLELGQAVALKFLPESMERDLASRSRFLHEVRVARRITHPNVCRVHDIGEAEGRRFLSMEYIEGEDLASLHRRVGRLPRDQAFEIARQLCQGLAAAHEQSILHRDLKPSNLMIDGRGRARITDFGIATRDDSAADDKPRHGTPAYMAPEQFAGEEASIRSDLYALGLVLYELFTGRRAFEADSVARLIEMQREGAMVPPSSRVPGLDSGIEDVILSCLEPEPGDRPESAAAVTAALIARETRRGWQPAAGVAIPQRPSWRLEKKLGEGGIGEVWLGGHPETGDRRVFKFCHEAEKLPTLQREIMVFRLLKEELGEREDITRILGWNFEEPPFFIESEYTEGGNLLLWAERRGGLDRVPLSVRLELVAQVATALAAAHSVGVLHKDVKPSNVLITSDPESEDVRARLTDFGLGSVTERQRLVSAGITTVDWSSIESSDEGGAGTRLYMAPELVEGKSATLQSDLYALGVMLYQMVMGDFSRVLAPGWGRGVEDELLREDIAISVDGSPERRLGDARRLARRLRSLAGRHAEREAERRLREQAKRDREIFEKSRKRRKLVVALVAALTVIAIAMGFLASLIAREKRRAELEADRARNIARIAVAGELLQQDPTRAALVLLEVENPDETAHTRSQIRQVLNRQLTASSFTGHEGAIRTAQWSPSGDRIVTTARDRTARVWQADGLGEQLVLEHAEPVLAAWFDPRDDRILTVTADGTARSWNRDGTAGPVIFEDRGSPIEVVERSSRGDRIALGSWSGTVTLRSADGSGEPRLLEGHRGPVVAISFSPDGDRVVTASQDGTARVWSTEASGETVVLAHRGALRAVSFSPLGDRVLTASVDGVARVWNADGSGEPVIFDVYEQRASLVDVCWSPAGDRVALSTWGTASVWSADGGGEPLVFGGHRDEVTVSFSPSGDQILTTSADGTTRIWSADGSREPMALDGHVGSVEAFFSPSGASVLTASRDGTARLWRLDQPTEPVVLRHAEAVLTASWSPSGDRVVTASSDGTGRIWRIDGVGDPLPLEGHDAAVVAAAWNPRGDRIVTASHDGTARIWPVDRSQNPVILEGHAGKVSNALWSPDGERVLTTSQDGTVRVWRSDGMGAPVILEGGPGGPVLYASWSPRGDRLAFAANQSAVLWNADGSGGPTVLAGHDFPIETLSFDVDGERLLTASNDGTARVWSVDSIDEPRILGGHDEFIFAASFSPSGDQVLTATADGVVRIWGAESVREPLELASHQSAVYAVSWSPRGDRFVTASEDGTARVWSANGAGDPLELEGHAGPVMAVSWSPRGDRVVTVSEDGTARVWRIDTPDLIAAIRAATSMCLDATFREKNFGESPEQARQRHAECERTRGREPRSF